MPRPASAARVLYTAPSPDVFVPPTPAFQSNSILYNGAGENMASSGTQLLGYADTFTVLAWCKVTSVTGRQDTIWEMSGGASSNHTLFQRTNVGAPPSCQYFGSHGNVNWPSLPLTNNTWHQYVVVRQTSSFCHLWIDGVDQGAQTLGAAVFADVVRNVSFGRASTGVPALDGRGAQLAVWSTRLSDAEIPAVYNLGKLFDLRVNQGAYVSAATLAHFWPMGKDVSPLLGQDLGVATAVDIEAGAASIDNSNRVADVP